MKKEVFMIIIGISFCYLNISFIFPYIDSPSFNENDWPICFDDRNYPFNYFPNIKCEAWNVINGECYRLPDNTFLSGGNGFYVTDFSIYNQHETSCPAGGGGFWNTPEGMKRTIYGKGNACCPVNTFMVDEDNDGKEDNSIVQSIPYLQQKQLCCSVGDLSQVYSIPDEISLENAACCSVEKLEKETNPSIIISKILKSNEVIDITKKGCCESVGSFDYEEEACCDVKKDKSKSVESGEFETFKEQKNENIPKKEVVTKKECNCGQNRNQGENCCACLVVNEIGINRGVDDICIKLQVENVNCRYLGGDILDKKYPNEEDQCDTARHGFTLSGGWNRCCSEKMEDKENAVWMTAKELCEKTEEIDPDDCIVGVRSGEGNPCDDCTQWILDVDKSRMNTEPCFIPELVNLSKGACGGQKFCRCKRNPKIFPGDTTKEGKNNWKLCGKYYHKKELESN